jgi:hypothetical protein
MTGHVILVKEGGKTEADVDRNEANFLRFDEDGWYGNEAGLDGGCLLLKYG